LGKDYLGDLKNDTILVTHVVSIPLKHVKVLSGFAVLVQKGTIKCVINLQNRKVLKVFLNALYGKYRLGKCLFADFAGSSCDSFIVAPGRIDLSNPSGVPVACSSQENMWIQIPKLEW
jgi:hypothetical protein